MKGIREALATKDIAEDDPRWPGRLLEMDTHLHFALKCLYGVQGLFANLASSYLDQVEMAILKLEPVHRLTKAFSFRYDDKVLLSAFWLIADHLLPPQIDRLLLVMDPHERSLQRDPNRLGSG